MLYYFTCPKMMALEAKNPFEGGLIVMERMAMTLEQLVEQRRIFVEENEQVIKCSLITLAYWRRKLGHPWQVSQSGDRDDRGPRAA